jgi:hypothetical protein
LNNFLHVACNYHYLGWVFTWKYLKQGLWMKIYNYIRGLHSVQSGVLPVCYREGIKSFVIKIDQKQKIIGTSKKKQSNKKMNKN